MSSGREVPSLLEGCYWLTSQYSLMESGWNWSHQSYVTHCRRGEGDGCWEISCSASTQPHSHSLQRAPQQKQISLFCAPMALLALSTQSVLPKNDVWIFPPTPPNCESFQSKGDSLFTFESLVPTRKRSTCQVLNKCLKKLIQLHWFPLFGGTEIPSSSLPKCRGLQNVFTDMVGEGRDKC